MDTLSGQEKLSDPGFHGVCTDHPAPYGLEDDTRFGALAAGHKIADYKMLLYRPGGVGEAAVRWSVLKSKIIRNASVI